MFDSRQKAAIAVDTFLTGIVRLEMSRDEEYLDYCIGWLQDYVADMRSGTPEPRDEVLAAMVELMANHLISTIGVGWCEQCHKQARLHKVKYADDTSIGSMRVCEECDNI